MRENKTYGVQNLERSDKLKFNGGFWLPAAITFFAIETINNPTESTNAFWSGYYKGYNYNQ